MFNHCFLCGVLLCMLPSVNETSEHLLILINYPKVKKDNTRKKKLINIKTFIVFYTKITNNSAIVTE